MFFFSKFLSSKCILLHCGSGIACLVLHARLVYYGCLIGTCLNNCFYYRKTYTHIYTHNFQVNYYFLIKLIQTTSNNTVLVMKFVVRAFSVSNQPVYWNSKWLILCIVIFCKIQRLVNNDLKSISRISIQRVLECLHCYRVWSYTNHHRYSICDEYK